MNFRPCPNARRHRSQCGSVSSIRAVSRRMSDAPAQVVFGTVHEIAQARLRTELQADNTGKVLERLAAALFGELLGVPVAVASSGFQHGGDAGPAGHSGRRFRLETKKYGETSRLSDRELLGEIDHALARDEALEAWVLVATRSVGEQLRQSLVQKGERVGVPVLVVSWEDHGLASVAALCAAAPTTVRRLVSEEAGDQALALAEVAQPGIEALRRDMASWAPGFEALRRTSRSRMDRVWADPRAAQADFGQDVAIGARRSRVRRLRAKAKFGRWLANEASADAPLVAFGSEGVGKTWAVLDWLHDGPLTDTILLMVPSSSVATSGTVTELSVKRLMADRFYEMAGTRDPAHWLRRLDLLLRRPPEEGPVVTLLLDGINQNASAPWLALLKVLQGPGFAGRVRTIVTTRKLHLEDKLANLNGLVVPASCVEIDAYDLDTGGELDQMLTHEGLTRADLHPDLVELARYPRLFGLVIRFRERLVEAGRVTVHRLLWEYGRDAFGARAGRSFSEAEWREWLSEIAVRWRGGGRPAGTRAIGDTVARPDLAADEVWNRLSDVVDGRFAIDGGGGVRLSPVVVTHALGAALLNELSMAGERTVDVLEGELAAWLEPIAGLDERAEILRASVSIGIERDVPARVDLLGVLVTAWLQTQNLPDRHSHELQRIAHELVDPLLDAIERSDHAVRRSARLAAVNALRAVPRDDASALRSIVVRGTAWLRDVDLELFGIGAGDADREQRRRERLVDRVGTAEAGSVTVLGTGIVLGCRGRLGATATLPALLEGFPLAAATPLFEAAAIAVAVAGHHRAWDGVKWLCLLNETDVHETREALRGASASMVARVSEAHVNRRLPARVAALLLWLTGFEADEEAAARLDPGLETGPTYEADYLPDPGRGFFALEWRHAAAVLEDPSVPFGSKVTRAKDLFLDPAFQTPPAFAAELRQALATLDPASLGRTPASGMDDHRFEVWQTALARVDADRLADFSRRKLHAVAAAAPDERYWAAVHMRRQYVLADVDAERAAAALRHSSREAQANEEAFASCALLQFELLCAPPFEQACAVIDAGLRFIAVELAEVLRPLGADEVGRLIDRYGAGTSEQRRDLLIVLSLGRPPLDDRAWEWVERFADGPEGDLRGLAFEVLARADARRRGGTLQAQGWSWAPDEHVWCNHWGSVALGEASHALAFEALAPRIAPALLLAVARSRGSDPAEVRLAARILDRVIRREQAVPDTGAKVTVDRSRPSDGPPPFSVALRDVTDDGVAAETAAQAFDEEARQDRLVRTAEAARHRIRSAQARGADLLLAEMRADDMRQVVRHAPDLALSWLDGCEDLTVEFVRRVQLAESTYLSLCEVLLSDSPARGVTLWRGLRRAMSTIYVGAGRVGEALHVLFRAPRSAETDALLDEVGALSACATDDGIADLVFAAEYNGRVDRIEAWQRGGAPHPWRGKRAAAIGGFRTDAELPVADAWPEGPSRTSTGALRRTSARLRWRNACARHWWRTFVAAPDAASAYAAWILYQEASETRDGVWLPDECRLDGTSDLGRLKKIHVALNARELDRLRQKRASKRDGVFLGRGVWTGFGPWLD
jgi:hypothetical protein